MVGNVAQMDGSLEIEQEKVNKFAQSTKNVRRNISVSPLSRINLKVLLTLQELTVN